MSARKLLEYDVSLIISCLKANIPGALADVRADRDDAKVSTEPPKEYFGYEKARGYRAPAVFVIGDNMDFRQQSVGANSINAISNVNVTVVVEDQDTQKLQIKAYRYMAALQEVLEQANLQSSDGLLKIVVRVRRAENSPLYSNAKEKNSENAVFRKEVSLFCEVEHYENF